jgi:molybdopterin molybdotransferase
MRSAKQAFAYSSPHEAIDAMLGRLAPVERQALDWRRAAGRILAQPLLADRDSPPCDVTAVDGFAVRLADVAAGSLPIRSEARIGQRPIDLPAGGAARIVTGAPIPTGAEAVVRREDVNEFGDRIEFKAGSQAIRAGQDIRRQGENLLAGQQVVEAGHEIRGPVLAALSTFGASNVGVRRKVRVGVVVTGDELLEADARPAPWQLRDANGPALLAMLSAAPWIELGAICHAPDEADPLRARLGEQLSACDAVLLTGGVSMGDRDHVPAVVESLGAKIIFHRLPIRPGMPVLGAIGEGGKAILGLPGNPVSVMVTACRFASPVLRRLAGATVPQRPAVKLASGDDATIRMWWYRLVRLAADGQVELVPNRGSGDLVAAARSDGFVEVPPGEKGAGPWRMYAWTM